MPMPTLAYNNLTLLIFSSLVRYEVLTAASVNLTAFSDSALYSLVEDYQRFRGACCLHHQGDQFTFRKSRTHFYYLNINIKSATAYLLSL
jgi:hypothetical protein